MKQNLFTLGAASILFLGACSGTSSSSTVIPSVVPLRAARVTNETKVTVQDLIKGSTIFTPGAYALKYERRESLLPTTLDQNVNDGDNVSITQTDHYAQSFRAGADTNLHSVTLELGWTGGEVVDVRVYSDGLPGLPGTPAEIASATQTLTGTGPGPISFFFTSPPFLTAGETYYITAEVDGAGSVLWFAAHDDTHYSDGTSYSKIGGTTYSPGGYDFTFSAEMFEVAHVYTYNTIPSTSYSAYPAGTPITINGGVAGKISFTPDSTAPVLAEAMDVIAAIK